MPMASATRGIKCFETSLQAKVDQDRTGMYSPSLPSESVPQNCAAAKLVQFVSPHVAAEWRPMVALFCLWGAASAAGVKEPNA